MNEHIPRNIKIAKKVFQYADFEDAWLGWPRDVYYDRKSNMFFIEHFPKRGHKFETTLLNDGPAEITVNGKTYKVKIYE